MSTEAKVAPAGFVHQAQIYHSEADFLDAALPFVRDAVSAGEPVLARVKGPNAAALREAAEGSLAESLELADIGPAESWYENPSRTRRKFHGWVERNARGGRRVRLIGEPPWPLESQARVREWARYESVVNLAFDGAPATLVCPYDGRGLPEAVIEHAESTHPELLSSAGVEASERYADPHDFCARLNGDTPRRRERALAELPVQSGRLGWLRHKLRREARDAGLRGERLGDLVVAANEVATNALIHGAPPATLRLWRGPAELVCEVTDGGEGIADPIGGQVTPDMTTGGGCGLWTARLLCDSVEYRAGSDGCTVALHIALPA